MRFPSQSLLRPGPPPDDLLMVVRGGTRTLSNAHLMNQVGDCWERHRFFGVSVFGAPDDDLVALSRSVRAIRIRPVVRVARCGDLRSAGFEVTATFPNPFHYSVVLPDASPATFEQFRECFGAAKPNPGHEPES